MTDADYSARNQNPEGEGDEGATRTPSAPTVVLDLPLAGIEPSPLNPRKRFDEEALGELAASVARDGVLEPLVVRALPPGPDGEPRHGLIAGERRLRAARQAGLDTVPARVLPDVGDKDALRLMLVENLS
jgi:ParB family chromosome partitioning protein